LEIALKGLDALNANSEESIHVCTGYVLSRVRQVLREKGYRVVPSRIVGETQRMVEEAFLKSLRRINVHGTPIDSGRRRFLSLLEWVQEDQQERERFVKTGWGFWKRLKKGGGSGGKT
jgi:hypothetical protein